MARPRTPTKILELKGSFKHDPQRKKARMNEPKPTGTLGKAPEAFTEELIVIWHELGALAPPGVLTNADRWLVEVACQLMLKFRTVGLIPKYGITGAEISQLTTCLTQMGLTPACRSKIAVPKQEKEAFDEIAALAAEGRAARIN